MCSNQFSRHIGQPALAHILCMQAYGQIIRFGPGDRAIKLYAICGRHQSHISNHKSHPAIPLGLFELSVLIFELLNPQFLIPKSLNYNGF